MRRSSLISILNSIRIKQNPLNPQYLSSSTIKQTNPNIYQSTLTTSTRPLSYNFSTDKKPPTQNTNNQKPSQQQDK